MMMSSLLLASLMTASILSIDAMKWFPGDYFDTAVYDRLERQVMTSWPGPSRLLEMWSTGELSEDQQVTLLVGGAAYHDPLLLPAYREGVESDTPRVRQAAVYGYRRLLSDGRPNISGGVDAASASALAREIDFLSQLFRRRSLIELWLQSLLAHEGARLPGWGEVKFDRPKNMCFSAVARLVSVHDLALLVEAFEISNDMNTRIGLLKLIERVSLGRFINKPTGSRAAWGPHVFEDAISRFETTLRRWRTDGCAVDGEEILKRNLAGLGVSRIDPLAPEGCEIWLALLREGSSKWLALVSRQLYACGGPWFDFSTLTAESKKSKDQRSALIGWFNPRSQTKTE